MATEKILIVDDEQPICNAISRLMAFSGFETSQANTAEAALKILSDKRFDLVISDHCMPGMKGLDFLMQIKKDWPETERILMSGYADLNTVVDAINKGEICRFIIKPWDSDELRKMIEEIFWRRRMVKSLKADDEQTYLTLAKMVELKDPYTKGHCERVANFSLAIAERIGLDGERLDQIRCGSWLHDCGKVGVPEKILNYAGRLCDTDFEFIKKHPEWGAEVCKQAGLSTPVINIVKYHHEHFTGGGYPYGLQGEQIPLEARIVAVADVFDALTSTRPYRKNFSVQKTRGIMTDMKKDVLDPELTDIFFEWLDDGEQEIAVGDGLNHFKL